MRLGLQTQRVNREGEPPRARLINIYSPRLAKTFIFFIGPEHGKSLIKILSPLLRDQNFMKFVFCEPLERAALAAHGVQNLAGLFDVQRIASAVVSDGLRCTDSMPVVQMPLKLKVLTEALNVASPVVGLWLDHLGVIEDNEDAFGNVTNTSLQLSKELLQYAAHGPYATYQVAFLLWLCHAPSARNLVRHDVSREFRDGRFCWF